MCVCGLEGLRVVGFSRLYQIKMTFLEVFSRTRDFGQPDGIPQEIRQFSDSLGSCACSQSHFPSERA